MKAISLAVFVVSCLLLSGCKSGQDVTGKWVGTLDTSGADTSNPGAAMAAKMLGNITLELKKDNTFAMTMLLPIEGTWSQTGTTVSLKITKAMGMDIATMKQNAKPGTDTSKMDEPMLLEVSSDGKTLTGKSPGDKKGITFKRDTSG